MAENWDEQFKRFLKRAGEDLKQMGEDIRGEAQKLIAQVQDPKKQEKVREKAREIGVWARQTASDVADLVEKGAAKAEEAILNYRGEGAQGGTSPQTPPPAEAKKPRTPARPAKKATATKTAKTVGAKKRPEGGAPKKKAPAAKTSKTIGRKKP